MVVHPVISTRPFSVSRGDGRWLLALLGLALLLGVAALAAPFFFALLLGGMVEVERDEKNMSCRY